MMVACMKLLLASAIAIVALAGCAAGVPTEAEEVTVCYTFPPTPTTDPDQGTGETREFCYTRTRPPFGARD